MRAVDIIRRKRDGRELATGEISFFIQGYSSGSIPDYQMSALLMAVYFRGMNAREQADLTEAMRRSGVAMALGEIPGRKVDKHSTGGVGDKTSLVVAPVVAAAGVTVPMISGRGLAHTGGTLDKLESIPGFRVALEIDEFRDIVRRVGVAIIGQTRDLVPADRKIYALRDVTATVDSPALMAASIMSKKLAEGIDGLVLDVKTGSGAFRKRQGDAEDLARAMVEIGASCGTRVVALITDMSQPLGRNAGNAVEVIECLELLKGRGPEDLVTLCCELSAYCLLLGDAVPTVEEGRELFRSLVSSGRALEKFRELVAAQGGNPAAVDDYGLFPKARHEAPLAAPEEGYVCAMDTEKIGLALSLLGAGRETVESAIDPSVGLRLDKKIGDRVGEGDFLGAVFYNDEDRYRESARLLRDAFVISKQPPEPLRLIRKVVFSETAGTVR